MPLDNSIGGAGAAPGSYKVLAQRPDTLVQPDGTLVSARTISAQVTTVGVWFEITISDADLGIDAIIADAGAGGAGVPTSGSSAAAQEAISQYAALIEAIGILTPVTNIVYLEGVNKQGNFADYLIVTVATPDGLNSADVQVPLDPTQETAVNNIVLATYANVQAIAALGSG